MQAVAMTRRRTFDMQASGFCYVNDLVLGILELLKVPVISNVQAFWNFSGCLSCLCSEKV